MPINKKQKLNNPINKDISNKSVNKSTANKKCPTPPYDIGTTGLQCQLKSDSQYYPVDIIERHYDDVNRKYSYYIHYVDIDRRLDCWVDEAQLQPKSIQPNTQSSPVHNKRINSRNTQLSSASSDAVIDATERLLEIEHEKKTRIKNVESIVLNSYLIDCWYYSPFPGDVIQSIHTKLYICTYCLKYMNNVNTYLLHQSQCKLRHPPGTEIYRDIEHSVSIYEVYASKHKLYCQCLCLLSKLFIDHKTLYYDVDNFIFYVLTEYKPNHGHEIVGYFSKELYSTDQNNLACIVILPPYQRHGYGKLLIELSYELTRIEHTVGSPEKPLSDLGRVAYKAYWITQIITYLYNNIHRLQSVKINEISESTGIKIDDTVSALQAVSLIKYVRGEHVLAANNKSVQLHYKQQQLLRQQSIDKGHVLFDSTKLAYVPYNQSDEETNNKNKRTTRRSGGSGAMSRS